MACTFKWYNLPKQIKEQTGIDVKWRNLPTQLNTVYKALVIQKPSCASSTTYEEFKWFSLPYKIGIICDLLDCVEPTLNRIQYPLGQCPSITSFETLVGFTLLNGNKIGDVITFNNVGYALPNNCFDSTPLVSFTTKAISAGERCFRANTGIIVANDLTTIGAECFRANTGSVTLNSLTTLSSTYSLAYNEGTIEADNLVTIIAGGRYFVSNMGTISIKSLNPIGEDTTTDESLMNGATATAVFNVNIANATNNGGAPDEDLQVAMAGGATVNYFIYP